MPSTWRIATASPNVSLSFRRQTIADITVTKVLSFARSQVPWIYWHSKRVKASLSFSNFPQASRTSTAETSWGREWTPSATTWTILSAGLPKLLLEWWCLVTTESVLLWTNLAPLILSIWERSRWRPLDLPVWALSRAKHRTSDWLNRLLHQPKTKIKTWPMKSVIKRKS